MPGLKIIGWKEFGGRGAESKGRRNNLNSQGLLAVL